MDNSNKPLNLWYRWFSPDIIVNNSNIAFIFVVVHGRKGHVTVHKNWSFSMKDFSSKCDQIRSFLRIWSHFIDKSLMGNFIFSPVSIERQDEKHSTKMKHFVSVNVTKSVENFIFLCSRISKSAIEHSSDLVSLLKKCLWF